MEIYGTKNKELSCFLSYPSNRMQCCKVNGDLSKFKKVSCGVPQGFCLGPLLFILYINDLPLSLKHSQLNTYADDTSLSFSADSMPLINENFNDDLDNLKTWHVAKTHSVIIGKLKNIEQPNSAKPCLVIGWMTISLTKDTKYLLGICRPTFELGRTDN